MKKSQILLILITMVITAGKALEKLTTQEMIFWLCGLAVVYGLSLINKKVFIAGLLVFCGAFGFFGWVSAGFFAALFTFLFVLGVLIYIHEAGHFVTARRNGVTCHEFGFGFPPRIGGFVKDDKTGVRRWVWGSEEYYGNNTLFSINAIPLGGFVRIKGENADPDQEHPDEDSFVAKSFWIRFKILFAGVTMNFLLGWVLVSIALMIGLPQAYNKEYFDEKIKPEWVVGEPVVLINTVTAGSAAQTMGIETGDAIKELCTADTCTQIGTVDALISAVNENKGKAVSITLESGKKERTVKGLLGTQDTGALGVNMAETVMVKYPPHIAIIEGFVRSVTLLLAILIGIFTIFKNLIFGAPEASAGGLVGPVGIAALVDKMRQLGPAFLLQISAILSFNLAVFNALPIPALDGGRILFLIIEKIKGSAVNPKVEGLFHTVSFTLLMLLMLFITSKEVIKGVTSSQSKVQQEEVVEIGDVETPKREVPAEGLAQ